MSKMDYTKRMLTTTLVSLVSITIFTFAAFLTYTYEIENHKQKATSEVELVAKDIESVISNQIYKSSGIAAYLIENPYRQLDDFNTFSSILYDENDSILRSVSLLKDTTVFFTFPIKGNEKVIGIDIAKIDAQKESVLKVKYMQVTTIDAPVNLVQGGRGIIIRIPITKKAHTSDYYGQMSVVLDYDKLQETTHLETLMETYDLQVAEKQNNLEPPKIIYNNIEGDIANHATYQLKLPGIEWQLYYAPKNGWNGLSSLLIAIVAIGMATTIIITGLVYKQYKANDALNLLVNERTYALIQTNEYLEQTLAEVEEKQAELFLVNDQLEQSLDHLKDTQEQLIQSEKFAALGELVAGVAHEINTPLGIGITLATFIDDKHKRLLKLFESGQLSKSELQEYNESVSEALSVMVNSLNRSAEIIGSFKNVAGEQSAYELRQFNVRAYFEDVLQNLKPRLKKTTHEVVLVCDPEIVIYHYPGVFSHILTNFIVNSLVHGFPEDKSGQITIEFYKLDQSCQLIYTDNGVGITEQHISKIFDPFYTTKKGQGSTGLGLHIVHNIVTQNLSGKIGVITGENEGVCFTIDFPIIHPADLHRLDVNEER